MVSLAQLTGGTPGTKSWLNLVSQSDSVNVGVHKYEIGTVLPTITVGSTPLTLTTTSFPSGVTVLDGTGNVTCPSSAAIDAALEIKTNGWNIWQDFVNRNASGTQSVIPPDAGAAINLPNAGATNRNSCTRLWFTRINGVWTCVN